MIDDKEKNTRTPTDTLMEALSSFGEDEPREVIVIYTTQNGDLVWNSSLSTFSAKLGMLGAAKFWIKEARRKESLNE